jgi:integrator complex subunit 2
MLFQPTERALRSSELFDQTVYLDKVTDVLCVALAELPAQLNAPDVSESLLHVRHGPWVICRVVANAPDTFRDGELLNV